ncbi:MAG: acetylglutamate kinase [Spirochaetes bacterium]|jgi:acetylglutamate kinase|nr:acetylglutamate kinase [Spirochaetota bacterium]
MLKYIEKINTLIESFPYIKKFYGKTFVIKYGGNAMVDEKLKRAFALDMVLLKYVGIRPVIVHGGGPQIANLLSRVGKESVFQNGLRVTDSETMDIAEMVLVGQVNKEIVNMINMEGGRAVGLSGKDANLILADKIYHQDGENQIDIGHVGTVRTVNPSIIETLDRENYIPVIAPIGVNEKGQTFNINADTAAGKIAEALNAEKLILLTDIEGIKDGDTLISSATIAEIEELIVRKVISGGMIPKTRCCTSAISNGVHKTSIIDGRVEHSVLLEVFTDSGIGSQIVLEHDEE